MLTVSLLSSEPPVFFPVSTTFHYDNGDEVVLEGYSLKGTRNKAHTRPISAIITFNVSKEEFSVNDAVLRLVFQDMPHVLHMMCGDNIIIHPRHAAIALTTYKIDQYKGN